MVTQRATPVASQLDTGTGDSKSPVSSLQKNKLAITLVKTVWYDKDRMRRAIILFGIFLITEVLGMKDPRVQNKA